MPATTIRRLRCLPRHTPAPYLMPAAAVAPSGRAPRQRARIERTTAVFAQCAHFRDVVWRLRRLEEAGAATDTDRRTVAQAGQVLEVVTRAMHFVRFRTPSSLRQLEAAVQAATRGTPA